MVMLVVATTDDHNNNRMSEKDGVFGDRFPKQHKLSVLPANPQHD